MPNTYDLISTTTLGSPTTSISITGIPSTYTDLRVTFYVPTYGGSGSDTLVRINGDTGGNYYYKTWNQNNSSAPNAVDYSAGTRIWINNQTIYSSTTNPTFFTLDMFGYAGTVMRKTMIITAQKSESNTAGDLARTIATWNSASAISSLEFACGNTFNTGSVVKLYGITRA